ncbi:hypothetical protein L1887_56450 [Cichorium endivia]|nr:hypothetical protein L1887_56450 [Cichorium endivia]
MVAGRLNFVVSSPTESFGSHSRWRRAAHFGPKSHGRFDHERNRAFSPISAHEPGTAQVKVRRAAGSGVLQRTLDSASPCRWLRRPLSRLAAPALPCLAQAAGDIPLPHCPCRVTCARVCLQKNLGACTPLQPPPCSAPS